MTQNLGPISDVSSVGLLNEIGTPRPLWTSLNDNSSSTFLRPLSGFSHVEAKFMTNTATFGRGNITSVAAFLVIDTTEVYSITATLLDNNSKAIATGTIESDTGFNFTLTYDIDNAASFDLSNLFIFFSIDTVSQSNLNGISEITFFSIVVTTEGGGTRQSGKCAPCQEVIPCDGLSGSHRLYFHDLSGSGMDTTGNCSAPVLQDNHFEYYGEHLIHKSNSLDFGVASVDLGMRHILTHDDVIIQLFNEISPVDVGEPIEPIPTQTDNICDVIPFDALDMINVFGESLTTRNNTTKVTRGTFGPDNAAIVVNCMRLRVAPAFQLDDGQPIIVSEKDFSDLYGNIALGMGTTNKASRDREYHLNSVGNDDNIYNVQQNFIDLYIDFLHTDNNGNKTYFDGHHLYDHYVYQRCDLSFPAGTTASEFFTVDNDCIGRSDIFLTEETIIQYDIRQIDRCTKDILSCFPLKPPCPPPIADRLTQQNNTGFVSGEHTYHDHRLTFALSAKAQLWSAPQSGRHHDNTGGYTNTGGVGLFFRNDLGEGIAFMPINNLPLSSGLIGVVDNANNFTPLDIEISGDSSVVFRDSDELTIGISEQTVYRVIRPFLPVDRVHNGRFRSTAHNIEIFPVDIPKPTLIPDINFVTSGTFVEVVKGEYTLSVSTLGHCFHEGETSSFIIPSGLFSVDNPPTDVGVCGFGGFQAKDLCVNFSHLREHFIPFTNHVVRCAQLCDEFEQPDFSGISERIITPPDDPSLYDFKGCFND